MKNYGASTCFVLTHLQESSAMPTDGIHQVAIALVLICFLLALGLGIAVFRFKRLLREKQRSYLPPVIEPVRLHTRLYRNTAIISGWASFLFGVVLYVANFSQHLPELGDWEILIAVIALISAATSIGSTFVHASRELAEIRGSLRLLTRRADLDSILSFDAIAERPRSVAAKRAAAEIFGHLEDLRTQIQMINRGLDTELRDWSMVSAFIRQLVNTLAERAHSCIWMGISLVTKPGGWDAQNEVVYQFDEAIQHAIFRGIVKRVYRLYFIDPNEAKPGLADDLQKAIQKRFSDGGPRSDNDFTGCYHFKISTPERSEEPYHISDVSFVFINQQVDVTDLPDPTWSRERLLLKGWHPVLALEWTIRNNFLVESLRVHSEDSGWFSEHYRKLHGLWRAPFTSAFSVGQQGP